MPASCHRSLSKRHISMIQFLVFVLIIAGALSASGQTGKQLPDYQTPVTREKTVKSWRAGNMLDSLLFMGEANKLPIGLVLEGDSLCKKSVPGSVAEVSVGALIEQIQREDLDYTAEIKDQKLYVHPKVIRASTLNALELKIPRFSVESESAEETGVHLWMSIRGILVPQETSMFSGGLQTNAETLPAINLTNTSVAGILNRTVKVGQRGVWLMYEVPPGWQGNPKTIPYKIFSYSGDQDLLHSVKCPEK